MRAKKVIEVVFGVAVLYVCLCYSGRVEWTDQVIYTMNETTYRTISAKLGRGCSQYDIASEYMENKSYYDSLND